MEDLGFLKWKDPLAWTETRGGPAFKKETRNFRKFVSQFSPEDLRIQAMKFMVSSHEHSNACEVHRELLVKPILEGAGGYEWAWKDNNWVSTANLDIGTVDSIPYVAYLLDVGTNQNDFFLTVHSKRRAIWTYRKGVGNGVIVSRNRVYCLESNRPLHYNRLVSLDLKTGKGRRIHYEEAEHSTQLELIKCERGSFLKGSNAGHEKLFLLDGTRLCPEGICFFTVGFASADKPVYFVRRGSFDAPWTLEGLAWGLNKEICASGIEYCSMKHRLLVTKAAGMRTFWRMGSRPRRLCSLLASVIPNHWTEDDGLWLTLPGMTVVRAELGASMILSRPLVQYGAVSQGVSKSADGLPVAWAIIQSDSKPKGLMLVAYGSYGNALPLSTSRWRPWIEGGWAVALLFIRGGGDDNEAWAEIGRRGGKLGSIEDVEACCKDLQRITGCGPKTTCLFGRSAGGLIVGNVAARHPGGDFIGILYAEVPYVDMLKTASNPKLPLTEFEYDEFANPRESPAKFEEALRLSPVHALGPAGAPGIKVLCRAGREDIQVYVYESLKWILTLRGGRGFDSKLLSVGTGGHYSSREDLCVERGEDYTIINAWIF
jgi:hypothetical protein